MDILYWPEYCWFFMLSTDHVITSHRFANTCNNRCGHRWRLFSLLRINNRSIQITHNPFGVQSFWCSIALWLYDCSCLRTSSHIPLLSGFFKAAFYVLHERAAVKVCIKQFVILFYCMRIVVKYQFLTECKSYHNSISISLLLCVSFFVFFFLILSGGQV